jgi:hypothetical protein
MVGQQPVAGVSLQLYVVGSSGYGSAATTLFSPGSVLTTPKGNFTFPAFNCPSSGALTYLMGTGGTPVGGELRGDSIAELATLNGMQVSPTAGFGLDAALNEPLWMAIDASGNVWVSNAGGNTITVFLGWLRPVATPLDGPPAAP